MKRKDVLNSFLKKPGFCSPIGALSILLSEAITLEGSAYN
jgi:hypothetical protein